MLNRVSTRTFSLSVKWLQTPHSRVAAEPFMNGSSGIYIEQMYESWLHDKSSVHKSWDAYFSSKNYGM
ncbi:unnamed protein product [Meloidogyne enterolobii]|uniref:Uncharacterized protein n=1 Tax=Meloidogyne enterolobii TaxID=390850 RepID=A0ACB0Z919_MELEN